ncbi:MAG: hypothetical protein FJ088_07360, partial [Deltaproteobacteria bacterium]|nr:hypothetical protein [Deltaproteobacteria bacterium]
LEKNRAKCAAFLLNKYSNEKDKKNEVECGLFADFKGFGKMIAGHFYEGLFPRVFGIPLEGCIQYARKPLWEKEIEDEEGNPMGSAFEEALKNLLAYGAENEEKAIFLFSDGKDGYLFGEDDCRIFLNDQCRKETPDGAKAGKCVESGLEAWKRNRQEIFREKLVKWLALLKAAGIRVFSVGYPTGNESELLRLELLALKSGGTYRFANDVNSLAEYFKAAADEISEQIVITIAPEMEPDSGYFISAEIKPEKGSLLRTASFGFTAEKPPWKVKRLFTEKKAWLEKKVGKTLAIVIIAAILIVVVLLAVLFTKLFIKLMKRIFKK